MTNIKPPSLKHPSALFWLASVYSLFMWAFGTLLAFVTLYFINNFHISQSKAYDLFAAYSALTWTLPLIGGFLVDRLGLKLSAGLGLLICCLGSGLMMGHSYHAALTGLAAFVVGNALFTPAAWCLVDYAYPKSDLRRESGFTLFYLTFNLGAVLGIFMGGYLQTSFSYHFEFLINTLFLLLSFSLFILKAKNLKLDQSRSIAPNWKLPLSLRFSGLMISILLGIPLILFLFVHTQLANNLLTLATIFAALSLVYIALRQKDVLARMKVFGFLILCIFSIAFWALYSLEPSLVSVFIDHSVNKNILGLNISASSIFGFEGLFIVLVGLLMSKLWTNLAKREVDIALSIKFSMALILIGLGYLYLRMIMEINGYENFISLSWVILAYLFFATGELFIGPLGIAMVGRLSPHGSEGYFMGVLQLFIGFSAVITGYLANFATLPEKISFAGANHIFGNLFLEVAFGTICFGVILLLLTPLLKKLV